MSEKNDNSFWTMIKANSFGILCGAVVIWSGYNTNTALTAEQIRRAEKELETLNAKLTRIESRVDSVFTGRRAFMKNAGDRLDYLCERTPSCERRFPPIDVPE